MTETPKPKPIKYTYFIGIDISKNELDFAVMKNKTLLFHREIVNGTDAIRALLKEISALPQFKFKQAIFCMEQTGLYGNYLLKALCTKRTNVVVENALAIKKTLGLTRGKNDKADAIRIAGYAQKNSHELKFWSQKRDAVVTLMHLYSLRIRLVATDVALKTPLTDQLGFEKKGLQTQMAKACKGSLEAIRADLAGVDSAISATLNADPGLKILNEIITSVPGIGPVTATQIILSTNEFKDIRNPKKFACYAGIAPFKNESGMSIGPARVSHIANKRMKSLLHVCAVRAIRCNEELRIYYERKTKTEGKHKMLVLNAVRYKLVLRIFACINQNRLYRKDYVRSQTNVNQGNGIEKPQN